MPRGFKASLALTTQTDACTKDRGVKKPDISEGLIYVGLMIDAVEGLRFRNQSHNYFSDGFE